MLREPLHHGGPDGRCRECGRPFPCPTGLAIFEAVKRELDHPTSLPLESRLNIAADLVRADEAQLLERARRFDAEQPPLRWEDLDDRADRCPKCLHWWVTHGVPTEDGYGCSMPVSSIDEREHGVYEYCGCSFAEGNPTTPREVRIWHDGTSDPTTP